MKTKINHDHSFDMPLLNYTTTIEVSKTVGEISSKLANAKACAILTELEDGIVSAISFRINTEFGVLTFRLPANVQRFYQVMVRDRRVPSRLRTKQQAARVAWRVVKDWLEAQLAMISENNLTREIDSSACARIFAPR